MVALGDRRRTRAGRLATESHVKAYRILVHDRRWREPVELAAEMARDERACEYARERLASSDYYDAVEVWRGEVKLCHLVSATTVLRAAA